MMSVVEQATAMGDDRLYKGRKSPLIILVGPYEPDRQASMERYAQLVQDSLRSLPVEHLLLRPQVLFGRMLNRFPSWRNHLAFVDKFLIFPKRIARTVNRNLHNRQVLLHVLDQGNSPCVPQNLRCPLITTCHDLIAAKAALGNSVSASVLKSPSHWFHSKVIETLERSQTVICVSDKTLAECRVHLKNTSTTLRRIYPPLDPFFSEPARSQSAQKKEILLHVGNSAWYKNRTGLFRIYSELRRQLTDCLDLHLYGEPLRDDERGLIMELNIDHHVVCHSHPSNEAIRRAYHRAAALIFPSLEEGFGWPPLEALACGCLVFTSNIAPMTETGGDAFQYFDPSDFKTAATQIASFLRLTVSEQAPQIQRGYARAAFFNVQQFTRDMSDVYATTFAAAPPSR